MSESPNLPRKLMLLIATLQGGALLWLKTADDGGSWPSQTPMISFPAWALAVSVPVLLLLSIEVGSERRIARLVGLFSIVTAAVSVYVGSQAEPYGEFSLGSLVFTFCATMLVACFKALMYIQQRGSGTPLGYDVLFRFSWRNALTFALALVFTGAVWIILHLWASLFEAIGVTFFRRLFEMDWFLFLTLGIAHGLGVIIFRNLVGVIDSLTRLLQGLIKLLLPLATAVAVMFVATLPFAGLDALWATGNGTALLLWLLAVVLFFTNAVYQDGLGARPYPLVVHRCLFAGLVTTPVLAVLAFYGLYLRLAEYGWTVARAWAFVVWLVLALFAIGYTVGIIRRRDEWTADLARVNTGMGLVVLALMILANSPLLDFRKLSASSQLARVGESIDDIRDFDAWYAYSELARPGYLARQSLIERLGERAPDLRAQLLKPEPGFAGRRILSSEEILASLHLRPPDLELPAGLRAAIAAQPNIASPGAFVGTGSQALVIRTDLDHDDDAEFVLLVVNDLFVSEARLFYRDGDEWPSVFLYQGGRQSGPPGIIDRLIAAPVSTERPRFDDLLIGDLVLKPVGPR